MPTLLLAAPIAALLAWLALRSRRPSDRRARAAEVNGAFVPGTTGTLAADVGEEEEPFKRRLLPEATGGELGQYGPQTQEQAPSGGDGGEPPPGPTQTYTMSGGWIAPTWTPTPSGSDILNWPGSGADPGKAIGPTGPTIYQPGQVVRGTVAE